MLFSNVKQGVLTFAAVAVVIFTAAVLSACNAPETKQVADSTAGDKHSPSDGHASGADQGDAVQLEDDVLRVAVVAIDGNAWGYSPNRVEVPVGQPVALSLVNHGVLEHDIEVVGLSAEDIASDGVADDMTGDAHHSKAVVAVHANVGKTMTVTFTPMTPGAYEFYCTVPGHREAGMVGTLTVAMT